MNKLTVAIVSVALAVIIASAGFVGGFAFANYGPGSVSSTLPVIEKQGVGARVDEVREMMDEDALVTANDTSATIGAINGLLESTGDKYGMYFDAKHYEYFNEESMGEFGGIGVTIGEKDGAAYIVEVFDGSPAAKAGLKTGDVFLGIDKIRRDKWTTDEVVKRVRGKEGTKVKLVVLRPSKGDGAGQEKTFTLERATIRYPNVKSSMKSGKVGYIRIAQFNANSADEIGDAITALEKNGAKSLVLDLRDNPGGLLDQAVGVSSLFVEDGVIVSVEERDKEPTEYRATGKALTDLPLFVLINENSASASEIVAGALQDYGRAQLVGVKSFGKGSVQTIHETSFGGAVKYTTAHYLTPKKRAINGKGLQPDVKVPMEAEKQADEKTDTQLQRALKLAQSAK